MSALSQVFENTISPRWSSSTTTPVNVDVSNSNYVGPQSLSYSGAPITIDMPASPIMTAGYGGYGGGSQPGFNSWQNGLFNKAMGNVAYWQQQYQNGAPGAGMQLLMAQAQANAIQGYTPSDYPGEAWNAQPWNQTGGGGYYGGSSGDAGSDYAQPVVADSGGAGTTEVSGGTYGPTSGYSGAGGNSSVGNGLDAYGQTLGGPYNPTTVMGYQPYGGGIYQYPIESTTGNSQGPTMYNWSAEDAG